MVKCPRCGENFASEQALQYHLLKRKIKCNMLTCKQCKVYFRSLVKYEIHNKICNYKDV